MMSRIEDLMHRWYKVARNRTPDGRRATVSLRGRGDTE
jgi:hypothetical protein